MGDAIPKCSGDLSSDGGVETPLCQQPGEEMVLRLVEESAQRFAADGDDEHSCVDTARRLNGARRFSASLGRGSPFTPSVSEHRLKVFDQIGCRITRLLGLRSRDRVAAVHDAVTALNVRLILRPERVALDLVSR